jgi:hypothetical protein
LRGVGCYESGPVHVGVGGLGGGGGRFRIRAQHAVYECEPPHALLPRVPQGAAVELLDAGFSRAFDRAGFRGWTVPIGCSEPLVTLKIER